MYCILSATLAVTRAPVVARLVLADLPGFSGPFVHARLEVALPNMGMGTAWWHRTGTGEE